MGMFDDVTCEYPLPDGYTTHERFQTKDFERMMDHYTITKEGRLIHHQVIWEPVPEGEQEDKWHLINVKPVGDVDTNYHGDMCMYTLDHRYIVRFTHGQVESIEDIGWD